VAESTAPVTTAEIPRVNCLSKDASLVGNTSQC
jgi:hypothetical protein